jgi:hypothetical protein
LTDFHRQHPLGKLVDGNQQVGVAPGRFSQGPDDVQPPHGKRPCDGDCLEGVCREVSFVGIKLAPFAGAHDLAGISDRSGPVEALAERVAHESAWRCVVAAYARVNVSKELAPCGMGTHRCRTPIAARLYSSPSTRVNDLAILAIRLASDRSGGSSPRSIQTMYLSRQSSARGTGSVSMASASSEPYPSSRESTNASFEGSLSIGSTPVGSIGALEGSSWLRVSARG